MNWRIARCQGYSAAPFGFAGLRKISPGLALTGQKLNFEEGETGGGHHQGFFRGWYFGPGVFARTARRVIEIIGESLLILMKELREPLGRYFLDGHLLCSPLPAHIFRRRIYLIRGSVKCA